MLKILRQCGILALYLKRKENSDKVPEQVALKDKKGKTMFSIHLSQVNFKDKTTVNLSIDSIPVIIGPNNSGKSSTLADVSTLLKGERNTIVLDNIVVHRTNALEDIKKNMLFYKQYMKNDYEFAMESIRRSWNKSEVGSFLLPKIMSKLNTRERLGDCDPVQSFDARKPFSAEHPFQHMYRDLALEEKASTVVRKAFKRDLVIHRSAGQQIPAYVGERPIPVLGEERFSPSYTKKLEALDLLEVQGDGIRSFVSIIGRVITEERPMQSIDEPEAFLHPPQARLIAEEIALHSVGRQTFIATHSSNVLQGLLLHARERVSIIRLTRNGRMKANYLSNSDVSVLWKEPILRFSNVLDGLFHDGVIVTESDADCRFYESFATSTIPANNLPDLHYTYSGGKERIAILMKSLAALSVPVASIIDFDILNNNMPLRSIVEAHGGTWSLISADWNTVRVSVENSSTFLDGSKFRAAVRALIDSCENNLVVPKEIIRELRKLARNASPWDRAKDSGLASIASGQATVFANRLINRLADVGIFVVPVGEVEGFCRSVGGHGPRWVEELLKRDIANDPELESARIFTRRVVEWLNSRRIDC